MVKYLLKIQYFFILYLLKMQYAKYLSQDSYLKEGDQIIMNYHNFYLYNSSFKSIEINLKNITKAIPISSIFIIQSSNRYDIQKQKGVKNILYGEKILIRHKLTGKYMSYSLNSNSQEIKLRHGKTENCLFMIKPIFKYQANFDRKIRILEQVCLQSVQNLKLYIQIGNKQGINAQSLLTMSKHQSSNVLLQRLNLNKKDPDSISTLKVYQLINIENQSVLEVQQNKKPSFGYNAGGINLFASIMDNFASQSRENSYIINFSKNINLYGSFLVIEPFKKQNNLVEQIIQYHQQCLFRFYTTQLYLSFDEHFRPNLVDKRNDNCLFKLQNYDDNKLKTNTVIKMKHIKSGLYVSMGKGQIKLQQFSLLNTYKLREVQYDILKATLMVNEIYHSFKKLLKEAVLFHHKHQFIRLIKQLTRFIFLASFDEKEFLKMNCTFKLKITKLQQQLLRKVGFISLLAETIISFFKQIRSDIYEIKSFYQGCISSMMIILMGVCYKNIDNIKQFLQYLPNILEGLLLNSGIISSLYHIFSDLDALQIVQKQQFIIKKHKYRLVQIIFDQIQRYKELQIYMKIKLMRLLDRLVIFQGTKIAYNQSTLIKYIKKKKLDNIIIPIQCRQDELYVNLYEKYIELSQIFQNKNRYGMDIELIRLQLNFLCSLFSHPNPNNLSYFRKIISQEVLYLYLKMKIPQENKQIFLRILNEIYLSSKVRYCNNIIIIFNQPMICSQERQISSIDQKIQKQIISTLKYKIQNQLIDSSLSVYLRAITQYIQLHFLGQKDVKDLQELLAQFVNKYHKNVNLQKDIKNVIIEVMNFFVQLQQLQIKNYSKTLIKTLKINLQNLQFQKIIDVQNELKSYLFNLINQQNFKVSPKYDFLIKLIEYSLNNQVQIFIKASFLLNLINNRAFKVIEFIKNMIIIDGDWIKGILQELNSNFNELSQLFIEYQQKLQIEQNAKLTGIKISITKLMQNINQIFFKWQIPNNQQSISPLIQNIIRQTNMHTIIANFIKDQRQTLNYTDAMTILSYAFQFSVYFCHNNYTNIIILSDNFHNLKWVFNQKEIGQSKLLYLLISNRYSYDLLQQQLKQATIISTKYSKRANYFGLINIIMIMLGKNKVDIKYIDAIAEQILHQPVWKNSFLLINPDLAYKNADIQLQQQNKGFYIYLIIKLFIVIIDYSKYNQQMINYLKDNIEVKTLLYILMWRDLSQGPSVQALGITIMKEQIINLINKVFQKQIYKDINSYAQFMQLFSLRLISYQPGNNQKYKIQNLYDIFPIEVESFKIKNNYMYTQEAFYSISQVIITVYFPFVMIIIQKALSEQVFVSRQNIQTLQSLVMKNYYKVKDFFKQLPQIVYLSHQNQYNKSLSLMEQVCKNNIYYEFYDDYQKNSNENRHCFIDRTYRHQQLHNLIDNYSLFDKKLYPLLIKIYNSIFYYVYCPQIKSMMNSAKNKLQLLNSPDNLGQIAKTLKKGIQLDMIDYDRALQLFWLFAYDHPYLMDFTLVKQKRQEYLNSFLIFKDQSVYQNRKQINIGKYLKISNYMMNILFSSQFCLENNIFIQQNESKKQTDDQYKARKLIFNHLVILIKEEVSLYQKPNFSTQLQSYQNSNSFFNYNIISSHTSIQDVLTYISNKLNIENHQKRLNYQQLCTQILILLRVYISFIKKFELKYISKEIYKKLRLCLEIISKFISPNNPIIEKILENRYYQQLQTILKLDDSWHICQADIQKNKGNKLKEISVNLSGRQKQWLQNILQIYMKSLQFYGDQITENWANFPLQIINNLYGPLKKNAILILRELKNLNSKDGLQILNNISDRLLVQNIRCIYQKHHKLYGQYVIFSVSSTFSLKKVNQDLSKTLCFQNGIDLLSILMYKQTKRSQVNGIYGPIQTQFMKFWEDISLHKGILHNFSGLLRDFSKYILKNQQIYEDSDDKIFKYFYSKMGRIELVDGQRLNSIQFLIRPQCVLHTEQKKEFISNINFISTQLKIQSILDQILDLNIKFNCYQQFYLQINHFKSLVFIEKYLSFLRVLNVLLVLINNVYLVLDSNINDRQQQYYLTFDISHSFEILLIFNILITFTYFTLYCIRNIPIIKAQIQYSLQIQQNNDTTKNKVRIQLIKTLISNYELIYNFIFLFLMFMAILNKLVIAILLIDGLLQIKLMKPILQSLWLSKGPILYSFISFYIIYYFYSLLTYYIFTGLDSVNCQTIGQCFGLILKLQFKQIGGLPGYLYYLQNYKGLTEQIFSGQDFFNDIYLVLSQWIFFSMIMVMIIYNYSKISKDILIRKQNLSVSCLICALSKTVFNKSANFNFTTHISVQHNVWSYAYYYHYLKKKPLQQLTRIQKQIVLRNKIDWFPNGLAKGFSQLETTHNHS